MSPRFCSPWPLPGAWRSDAPPGRRSRQGAFVAGPKAAAAFIVGQATARHGLARRALAAVVPRCAAFAHGNIVSLHCLWEIEIPPRKPIAEDLSPLVESAVVFPRRRVPPMNVIATRNALDAMAAGISAALRASQGDPSAAVA
ncbi:MAG TPA: hypothetical protein VN329_03350, partial [Roseomonas sp.]|nr:hypothetical protein [Roseomonas sp.]